jgi:hypothetical protein
MKPPRPFIAAAALLVALAGAALAGVVAHATSAATTVKVSEREFKITVTGKPAAGVNKFVIKNTGKLAHALVVAGPGVKKKTPLIKPGKTYTLIVTLKSGAYSIWCPVPGHAAQGMKASFKIGTAATSSGSGGTSTTTDTSGGGPAWG